MAKRESKLPGKIDINMTPMIDVVFQLLTFFMLTLKTVVVEGDFNIRMPLGASAGAVQDEPITALVVKMTAASDGRLTGVMLGSKKVVGEDVLGDLASADATLEAALAIPGSSTDKTERVKLARRAKEGAAKRLEQALQSQVLATIGDPSRADQAELELDCDPALKYDHVISAINAASGINQGDQVIPLIQKIKFSPPKKQK